MKTLCRLLELQCIDQFEAAAQYGSIEAGRYQAVTSSRAFSRLVCGDIAGAASVYYGRLMVSNPASEWLGGVLALAENKEAVAASAFGRCLRRSLTEEERADPNLWLRIWDEIPSVVETYPAFYFPRLPARLTGLSVDLTRLEAADSVIRPQIIDRVRLLSRSTDSPGQESSTRDDSARRTDGRTDGIVIYNNVSSTSAPLWKGNSVGDTYNINGPTGAVGPGATSHAVSIGSAWQPSGPDQARQLVEELTLLHNHLVGQASTAAERTVAAEIEAAAVTADSKDMEATAGHLRRAGRWALGAATTIGTAVAAAAIKAAVGV